MSATFRERGGGWLVIQLALMLLVLVLGLRPRQDGQWAGAILPGAALMFLSGGLAIAGVLAWNGKPTPFPKPRERGQLLEGGIYAWLRHPLYASLMLLGVGWAMFRCSGTALAAAVVLGVFFDAKARREERWMREKFSGYAGYERRVRRFIPWVY